ncbi:MAG TPA: phosphoribosyltransferase domain-containing protein [Planktothrix sp.]|jgi:hypothetical protein
MTNLFPAVPAQGSVHHVIELPTGDLSIRVDQTDIPLESLCGFAARRNPKRGFLFVSRVLGKHIPVRPSVMRDVHTRLAAKIAFDLPGPVAFVGMAETAIGLGHGVYEEYLRLTGREDTVFVHSTRYRLDRPVALEFLEEHSHAADHIIYMPDDTALAERFAGARSLVLIDDEASTGKTFINVSKAFKRRFHQLERAVTVIITDWRGEQKRQACHASMPIPTQSVSVLQGEYTFHPAPNLQSVVMPNVAGNGCGKDRLLLRNYGRHGVGTRLTTFDVSKLNWPEPGQIKLLVLGTGEFAYAPFLLAEQLEKHGLDVHFQSTTRSPIMLGGAIEQALTFEDNYEDGIPNFLYNATAEMYDDIIVCHETPTVDEALLKALSAKSLEI